MSRAITIALLVILALSSFVTLQTAVGATKLATPEFNVAYSDHSYDTSTFSTIDPYTGKVVLVSAGHVEDRTIHFLIKYKSLSEDSLHFVIRMKGHYSSNWTAVYDGWANSSGPELTDWAFSTLRGYNLPGQPSYFYHGGSSFYVPTEGELDFQVKAQTWGEVMATTSATNPFGGSITTMFGESDWSSTQTITIGNGEGATSQPTPAPSQTSTQPTQSTSATAQTTISPTETPSQPNTQTNVALEVDWKDLALTAACIISVVLAVTLVLSRRKRA